MNVGDARWESLTKMFDLRKDSDRIDNDERAPYFAFCDAKRYAISDPPPTGVSIEEVAIVLKRASLIRKNFASSGGFLGE